MTSEPGDCRESTANCYRDGGDNADSGVGEKDALTTFQAVPELPYQVVPDFFKMPEGAVAGEASGVAVNSKGHIFLFQRTEPMLAEYDAKGVFVRSLGTGLFTHPHGLRIDAEDNIWTTDDGSHVVLKLDPMGKVLLVLGRIHTAGEADWLFNAASRCGLREEWRDLRGGRLWQFAHCEV